MSNQLRIAFFSDEEVRRIYKDALSILETVGFEVQHEGALRMFRDNGALVDKRIVKVKSDKSVEQRA